MQVDIDTKAILFFFFSGDTGKAKETKAEDGWYDDGRKALKGLSGKDTMDEIGKTYGYPIGKFQVQVLYNMEEIQYQTTLPLNNKKLSPTFRLPLLRSIKH